MDDFIFISPASSPLCSLQLKKFLSLSAFVGIPINESKTVLPATSVPIHGILVDTLHMQAHLPQDKLLRLLDLVTSFSHKRAAKVKLWQSLLGNLSFACRVVGPGRPFLRRMFNLLRGHVNQHHFIRIPHSIRSDCIVWKSFLAGYNGVSLLLPLAPLDSDRLQFFSDTSAWGCAATFGPRWFQIQWTEGWRCKHINVKEFLPILLALDFWGPHFRHSSLTFRCDNQAVVEVPNSGTTRDPDMLIILRAITLLALQLDIHICALHLPGKLNGVADKPFRMQVSQDFLLSAGLLDVPTPMRTSTLRLILL